MVYAQALRGNAIACRVTGSLCQSNPKGMVSPKRASTEGDQTAPHPPSVSPSEQNQLKPGHFRRRGSIAALAGGEAAGGGCVRGGQEGGGSVGSCLFGPGSALVWADSAPGFESVAWRGAERRLAWQRLAGCLWEGLCSPAVSSAWRHPHHEDAL